MLTASALLQYLAWIYLGAAALGIVLALKFAKGIKGKAIAALLVLALFSYWPVSSYLEVHQKAQIQREKLNVAMARFEERCKTAGEKIYRTVEDVEGILLMKVRPAKPSGADSDPMWPEAGVPDRSGDDYLFSFLRNTELHPEYLTAAGNPVYPTSVGYRFVDVVDQKSGSRFRYSTPDAGNVQHLVKQEAKDASPRFGVTYEAFVDLPDRQSWVAGGVIRVVDLSTQQVIAEKTGFLIDPSQGSTAGFRSPWGWAQSYGPKCPADWGQGTPARSFVDQVLKPKKGE